MKIGLIVAGAGRMGSIHVNNIGRISRAELPAIVDPDLNRARVLAEKYGVPYYPDLGDALKALRERVRGVVIASPLTAHLENVRSLHECKEIYGVVRKRGVKLQVGYQRRFDKNYREVKRMLSEGLLGKPLIAKFIARDPMPEPGIGLGRIYRGALFDDMVTHEFDLIN